MQFPPSYMLAKPQEKTRIIRQARSLFFDVPTVLHDPEQTVIRPAPTASRAPRSAPSAPVESTRVLDLADLVLVGETQVAPAPTPSKARRPGTGTFARLVHSVITSVKGLTRAASVTPASTAIPVDDWRRLRTVPLLDGMPNAELGAALESGDVRLLTLGRDDLLDADAALVVVSGQVALARFAPATLETERAAQTAARAALTAASDDKARAKLTKKETRRRGEAGPLVRLADKNLAFFTDGDLVDVKLEDRDGASFALHAVTPAVVVAFRRPCLDAWKKAHPFLADRLRRASQSARQRLDAVAGARGEVADFFLRHGFSVALTMRVRQIDQCIECGACEAACEERYGKKRLSLHGRVLGGLDFVDACHTCTDQRCIDPCAFDAIRFDAERREVVIVEAACTGCTLCATACPYNAIEMHDLDAAPRLQLRLETAGALAFGEGTPRKAKLKRMASKCDHCVTYADQACISACPTGALLEAAPADVFRARPAAQAEAAAAGFDHTAHIDASRLNDPRPFVAGSGESRAASHDRGRALRPRIWTPWMWGAGLGAWLVVVLEIAARKLAPDRSLDFLYLTLVDGLDGDVALARVDYRPGCELAVRLGWIGSIILFSGLLYPARRRLPWLARLGSQRAWFEMHVLTGVVGPLFILLHTAAKLDNWVSLGFWSLVGTVVSGLVGRYLATQLPALSGGESALEVLEVESRLAALRPIHTVEVAAIDRWSSSHKAAVAAIAPRHSLRVLVFLLVDDVVQLVARFSLGRALAALPARARREALACARGLARHQRRHALLPRLEPLFRRWKLVHVPFAIVMTLIATLHIALALLG